MQSVAPQLFHLFACKPDGICSIEELMTLVSTGRMKVGSPTDLYSDMQAFLYGFEQALSGGRVCEMDGSGYYQLVSVSASTSQRSDGSGQVSREGEENESFPTERDRQLIQVFVESRLSLKDGDQIEICTRTLKRPDGSSSTPLRAQALLVILVCANMPEAAVSIPVMAQILSSKEGDETHQRDRVHAATANVERFKPGILARSRSSVQVLDSSLLASVRPRPTSKDMCGTGALPVATEAPRLGAHDLAAPVLGESQHLTLAQHPTLEVGGQFLTLCVEKVPKAKLQSGVRRLFSLFACKPDRVCSIEELMILGSLNGKYFPGSMKLYEKVLRLLDAFELAVSGSHVRELEGSGYYQLVHASGQVSRRSGAWGQAGSKRTRTSDLTERDRNLIDIFDNSKLIFADGAEIHVGNGTMKRPDGTHTDAVRRQALLLILVCASVPDMGVDTSEMVNILSGPDGGEAQRLGRVQRAASAGNVTFGKDIVQYGPKKVVISDSYQRSSARPRPGGGSIQ